MKKENGNDLLLAKRRILVIFPFFLLNLAVSITMLVFISIVFYRINEIKYNYKIEYNDYQYENNQECNIISNKIRNNNNFTEVFNIVKNLSKIENPVGQSLGYSITGVSFLTGFLLISMCLIVKYARPSDEKIEENPSFIPNKNHPCTTCFIVLKIFYIVFIQVCLITSLCVMLSMFYSNLFKTVYNFADKCVKDKDSFKKKYSYFWGIGTPLSIYTIFVVLNLSLDITSVIFINLTEKYNVWSCIFNKLTCGKYEYKDVDYKGFINPQEREEEEESKNIIGGAINENDYD